MKNNTEKKYPGRTGRRLGYEHRIHIDRTFADFGTFQAKIFL